MSVIFGQKESFTLSFFLLFVKKKAQKSKNSEKSYTNLTLSFVDVVVIFQVTKVTCL